MRHSSDSVELSSFAFTVVPPATVPVGSGAGVPAIVADALTGPLLAAAHADTVNPGDDDDDDDDDDAGKGGGNIDPDEDEGYGDDEDDDDDEEPLWAIAPLAGRPAPAGEPQEPVATHSLPAMLHRINVWSHDDDAHPIRIRPRRRHTARPVG